jgi:mRNA interferase HigB
MHIISIKKLRLFWRDPRHPDAESPLRAWFRAVKSCEWTSFADVRRTYATADAVGNKVVFDIGGNKYRLIAVIDYEGHKVFVRHVLDHKEYDKGLWKKDAFGENWRPRPLGDAGDQGRGKNKGPRRRGGR